MGYIIGQTAAHFEHDAPWPDHRHPKLDVAFAFAHACFSWLVSNRLVGKDTDPNFTAAAKTAHDGATGSLDLAGGYPARFQSLKTKLAERHLSTALGFTTHAPAHLLAPLNSFWH
jgi:hypothetical protein